MLEHFSEHGLYYTFSAESSGRPYHKPNITDSLCISDNAFVAMHRTQVIYAGETERFTHKRHDTSFPYLPMQAFKTYFDATKYFRDSSEVSNLPRTAIRLHSHERKRSAIFQDISQTEPSQDDTERNYPHSNHLNHILEVFYQSGFKESAVLVNNRYGEGENICLTLAYMKEGAEPRILKEFDGKYSPCYVYQEASKQIFNELHAEAKMMGIASYGKNNGKRYIWWDSPNNTIKTDEDHGALRISQFLRKNKKWNENPMYAKDLAFTIQKNFEDTIAEVMKYFKLLLEQADIETKNLCLSGGGIFNSPTNSRIVDLNYFENYYASPQPGDACAQAVGRTYAKMNRMGLPLISQRTKSSYLGVSYPINELFCSYQKIENPFIGMTNFLKTGGVIGWYQGGAEYGPRSMGHRSFLADPTSKETALALNAIKGREKWRPICAIVPEELFTRIFDVENVDMCEFLHRTIKVKEKWQPRLEAICHNDGTTLPQLLRREINPQLYDLIMTYFKTTRVPCLATTSLSMNGFPIVETPHDLCNLQEEICHINGIPEVKMIFVEGNDFYEVIPNDAWVLK